MCKTGLHVVLDRSHTIDMDDDGDPIAMTPNVHRAFVADQGDYDQLDNSVLGAHEVLQNNPKVKYLTETGGFTTPLALLQLLKN